MMIWGEEGRIEERPDRGELREVPGAQQDHPRPGQGRHRLGGGGHDQLPRQ